MIPNSDFSIEKFRESLKLRTIWLNNLRHENSVLKNLLVHAFFPYHHIMEDYMKSNNPVFANYEIDSYLSVKNNFKMDMELDAICGIPDEVFIDLCICFVPKFFEEDIDLEDYPPIELTSADKKELKKIANKFGVEMGLKVKISYD